MSTTGLKRLRCRRQEKLAPYAEPPIPVTPKLAELVNTMVHRLRDATVSEPSIR